MQLMAQSTSVLNDRLLTDWVFQWGQWITHDMDLTRNGPEFNVLSTGEVGDFSIPILDPNDPLGPNPIPFNRSQFAEGTGADGVRRDVVNSITSYIDASMVYGSDAERAAALRTFQGGKLKTSANGQLLPLNTAGLDNADALGLGDELFLAGDVRANEQANLTAVHTLFVREHNRLADRIHSLYPTLNDEEIYQLARRIVGAEMQIITYEEYLPAVFGYDLAPDPDAAVYDPTVNASITNSFAHAVFRFGHSQISATTLLVNNSGQTVGSLSIARRVFQSGLPQGQPEQRGPGAQGAGVTAWAGERPHARRRHPQHAVRPSRRRRARPGRPRYPARARPRPAGLQQPARSLRPGAGDHLRRDQLRPSHPGAAGSRYSATSTTSTRSSARWPRTILPGASVGEFIHAVVGNQFERLRDGDRFFYTNDPLLQSDAVTPIIDLDKLSLSQVIRWNTPITNIQDNVFFLRAEVSGEVFDDRDRDGRKDRGEGGFHGITVQLLDDAGEVVATTVTDRNGRYRFVNTFRETGDYQVRLVLPSGYSATTPVVRDVLVSRGDAEIRSIDFGLRRSFFGDAATVDAALALDTDLSSST